MVRPSQPNPAPPPRTRACGQADGLREATGLAGGILASLEREIESGTLPPGAVLDERALAHRFGVSRTPVREALQQLCAGELVCIAPRQGVTVARLSIGKVRAMLEYVGELEALAASLAARRGDEALYAALDDALRCCREASEVANTPGYAAANSAFHEAIYTGCRNHHLAAQIRLSRRRLQRYRLRDFATRAQMARSLDEHMWIASAIHAADEAEAARAMSLHVPAGTTGFAEFLATVPAHYFDAGAGANPN